MADSTCHCPRGTEYAVEGNGDSEAGYDQPQSVRIEYCRKRGAKRSWVRQGPCIVRGPNDERYEEGQYVDGQRDGVWIDRRGMYVYREVYDRGQYLRDSIRVVGTPDSVTIDFCNCRVHGGLTYQPLGSSTWHLRGATGDTCVVLLDHAIEGAHDPVSVYHVPRSLGRVTLSNSTQNWTVLKPYFVGTEGEAYNEWFIAR